MRLPPPTMFLCRLPPSLAKSFAVALTGRSWQAVLLPLVIPEEYVSWLSAAPGRRSMLSAAEEQRLAAFSLAKRRSEWLTGRICAKLALERFLSQTAAPAPSLPFDRVEVRNHPSGRPYLHSSDLSLSTVGDLSISHSRGYAIALVADSPCGIDIQRNDQTLERVSEKFCLPKEVSLIRHSLPETRTTDILTLLWAAKEAARKAFSATLLAGFLDMELTAVTGQDDSCRSFSLRVAPGRTGGSGIELRVVADLFGDYAIAACVDKGLADA